MSTMHPDPPASGERAAHARKGAKVIGFRVLALITVLLAVAIAVAMIATSSGHDDESKPGATLTTTTTAADPVSDKEQEAYQEAQRKIATIDREHFNKVDARNHHKSGRVAYQGVKNLTVSEKLRKFARLAEEDPVVTASILQCLAPGSYTQSELDKLARSKQGSDRHWRYFRSLRQILSHENFQIKNIKFSGKSFNEGRSSGGQRTSTPSTFHREPAQRMVVPTTVLDDGKVVRGGSHISLEKCVNCQTTTPVGITTPKPGCIYNCGGKVCRHNCEQRHPPVHNDDLGGGRPQQSDGGYGDPGRPVEGTDPTPSERPQTTPPGGPVVGSDGKPLPSTPVGGPQPPSEQDGTPAPQPTKPPTPMPAIPPSSTPAPPPAQGAPPPP